MSNPPNPYNRSYNFEDFQTLNPNSPLPAQHIENELNNIEETLDATVSRLAEIQNADGSIKLTANVQQLLINAATVEATNVANQVSEDYLAANFDSNAAAAASSSASAAAQSALLAEASKVQANAYSVASQQSAVTANMNAVSAISSKNAAEDFADSANASKIAAHGYKLSAQNAQVGANSVYQSALQLKEGLDSNYGQLLYKREDVNHVGANMLFNGGDIDNTLIGKIFPGTSFDLNSKLVNNGPINITGLNYINGPWWVEGNAQAENPSDIVTRDMMNCLVQTWKTFGPNVSRGELKPMQTGVNGTPNPAWSQTDFPNTTFIKPIVYDETDFNANQSDPVDVQSAALTPKGYVDRKLQDKLTYKDNLIQLDANDTIAFSANGQNNLSISSHHGIRFDFGFGNIIAQISPGYAYFESNTLERRILINSEEIILSNKVGGVVKNVYLAIENELLRVSSGIKFGNANVSGNTLSLTREDNLLKVSTGIKFPDGTTLTTASLSGSYLPLSGGTMTGQLHVAVAGLRNPLNENFIIDAYNDTGAGTHNLFKFNPYGGGLELPTNSSGIKFGDATTQTTAGLPLTGGVMSGDSAFIQMDSVGAGNTRIELAPDETRAEFTNLQVRLTGSADLRFADDSVQTTAGLPLAGGGTVSGNVTISLGNVEDELQTFVVKNYNANPYFVVSPYENYSQLGNVILDGDEIAIKDPANSNVTMLTLGKFSSSPNIYGIRYNDNSIQTTAFIPANYAALAGATFTGKVNVNTGTGNVPLNLGITGTPTSYTVGDVWIAGADMRFRDSAGATKILISAANSNAFTTYQSISSSNNSNPALKITQLGTGEALRVEDETSPDATAFVVSNNGRVGIGVAPDATVALTVDSTGVKFNDSSVQVTKGDRYKATSQTSNTVDSGNGKSFTTQPKLAYTPYQKIVIVATGTSNHMHGQVVSYDENTGELVFDADTNTGSGTHTNWTINVGG